jgi:hypothetical protein
MTGPTEPRSGEVSPQRATVAGIRNTAFWAFIAAVLLLYFGFQLKPPSSMEESGAWLIGGNVLVYVMRIGGFALVLAGMLLVLGVRIGLALDGAFSILIGLGMAIGGALLLIEGGANHILYVIFGVIFIFAGRSSLLEYRRLGVETARNTSAAGLTLFGGGDPRDERGPDY